MQSPIWGMASCLDRRYALFASVVSRCANGGFIGILGNVVHTDKEIEMIKSPRKVRFTTPVQRMPTAQLLPWPITAPRQDDAAKDPVQLFLAYEKYCILSIENRSRSN